MAGCCDKVLTTLVLMFNTVFWVAGAALLGFFLWFCIAPPSNAKFEVAVASEGNRLRLAAYIFLGTGFLTVIVGFYGYCGAAKSLTAALITYAVCLAVIAAAVAAAAAFAVLHRDAVMNSFDTLHNRFAVIVKNKYGVRGFEQETNFVDLVQNDLQCCGPYNSSEWLFTEWFVHIDKDSPPIQLVPESCCVPSRRESGRLRPRPERLDECLYSQVKPINRTTSARHELGCAHTLGHWVRAHFNQVDWIRQAFVYAGVAFGAFTLLGASLSLLLYYVRKCCK